MNSLNAFLEKNLEERRHLQRYRQRLTLETAQDTYVEVNGERFLNFCSNDYLGLASHPALREAMVDAAREYGVGSGASHLVCGHSEEHHRLEQELAEFTGRDRALLFSTGYMANMGVIAALSDRAGEIFEDKLNHASLIDGAMLSRAKFSRYRHLDTQHLGSLFSRSEARHKLLVTDSVFSMDGDLAPLDALADCAKEHDAWLMVDDAHGIGVMGKQGAGAASHFMLDQGRLPVLIGTFGKAFGTFGAFVAGSQALIEYLIQFARTYIYTTAIPPPIASASRVALSLVQQDEWRREKLAENIAYFRQASAAAGLRLMVSDSPIQPVLVGRDTDALMASEALRKSGVLVSAIRPPTVPEGTARLRVTLTAKHSVAQLNQLIDALRQAVEKLALHES